MPLKLKENIMKKILILFLLIFIAVPLFSQPNVGPKLKYHQGMIVGNVVLSSGSKVGTSTSYWQFINPDIVYTPSDVGIGTDSPTQKLHVVGTTEQLRLGYDVTNYTGFTIDSGGDLEQNIRGGDFSLISTNSGNFNLKATASNGIAGFDFYGYRATSGGAKFQAYVSGGTQASPTAIPSNANTLWFRGLGYDGTDYHRIAEIFMKTCTVAGSSVPGCFYFNVNAGGGIADLETALYFNSSTMSLMQSGGNVGICTDSPEEELHVVGESVIEDASGNKWRFRIDPTTKKLSFDYTSYQDDSFTIRASIDTTGAYTDEVP